MAVYRVNNIPAPIRFGRMGLVERTVQNAKNLIMLRRGELPYDRTRGLDPDLYHLPVHEARDMLPREIDRVMMLEPDAAVVWTDCHLDERGELIIEADIEIDIEE